MKKDNRGMSLVELMVAVAMLAVIVTPMLHSFLVSMRNNSKSRTMFRATTVANNLMESLEAFTLEEICMQFNTQGNFVIYPQAEAQPEGEAGPVMQYKELGEEVEGTIVKSDMEDDSPQFVFKGTPSNKYYFVMKNIQEDGHYFDAKITLDASKYREGDPEITRQEHRYNEKYTFDVDAMNHLTDAVFICKAAEEKKVYEKFANDYNVSHDPDIGIEDVIKTVKREISIGFVDYNGADATYVNGSYVNLDVKYIFGGEETSETQTHAVTDVRNVYVMFYPNYCSKETAVLDEIIVESDRQEPFKLYLIKQNIQETEQDYLTEYYGAASLELLDQGYWTDIKIKDLVYGSSEISQTDFTSAVNLRTNLTAKINTSEDEEGFAENQGKVWKHFSLKYYDKDGSTVTTDRTEEILQFVNGYPQSLAGEIKNKNLMYETIVEIYPQGTYDSGVDKMNEEHRLLILNRK